MDTYEPSGEILYRVRVNSHWVPDTTWASSKEDAQGFAALLAQIPGNHVEVVEAETIVLVDNPE